MGWLIGLPLGIFRMLLGILMVLVRLAVPILVIAVVIFLWRRSRRGGGGTSQSREPDFDGPVYTVDYEEVDDDGEDGHGAC